MAQRGARGARGSARAWLTRPYPPPGARAPFSGTVPSCGSERRAATSGPHHTLGDPDRVLEWSFGPSKAGPGLVPFLEVAGRAIDT